MKAISTASLNGAAVKRVNRAKDKLHRAEEELRAVHEELTHGARRPDAKSIAQARQQASAAEHQVHQAAQELDVATELLTDHGHSGAGKPGSRSGQGLASVMKHLPGRH